MSRIASNNIFGRPAGKTQGIIFGSARSRTGKIVTTRGLVIPSNPNTALQQAQRGKFSSCQNIVRRLGPTIYQSDFNRAIGQLPGFQSLNSVLLNQMDSSLVLTLVTPINLGTLTPPVAFAVAKDSLTSIACTWEGGLGSNGTNADVVKVLAIAKTDTNRQLAGGVASRVDLAREDLSGNITDLVSGAVYEVYAYTVGVGNAAGLLSVSSPYEVSLA